METLETSDAYTKELLARDLIPPDKSWLMRMGVLDILGQRERVIEVVDSIPQPSDDVAALRQSAISWPESDEIDVGESGTLFRFLQFASWKEDLDKTFKKHGTLVQRKITSDPSIVDLPQEKLLELDEGTSQWASAAILSGDEQRLDNPSPKLALTYKAVKEWADAPGGKWTPKVDRTILNQALAHIRLMRRKRHEFKPEHSEDFCYAYTVGFSIEAAEEKFPSLKGHETNRLEEMPKSHEQLESGETITSRDHRVVQALAMLAARRNIEVNFEHPEAVNKSWPQFWNFLTFSGDSPQRNY